MLYSRKEHVVLNLFAQERMIILSWFAIINLNGHERCLFCNAFKNMQHVIIIIFLNLNLIFFRDGRPARLFYLLRLSLFKFLTEGAG